MEITFVPARDDHLAALRAIELAAFETLREAGAVTGEPAASSIETLAALASEGLLFVALLAGEIPVGFAGGNISEGWLHVAEADVHPEWQRRGVGRRLMQALLTAGKARGLKGATLTTDRYAPFNAPFYASLGFKILGGDALSARLQDVLKAESRAGLDPRRRVAMQLKY